jgi:hypothetical protein
VPEDLLDAALVGWDEVVALGEKAGFRNGQLGAWRRPARSPS